MGSEKASGLLGHLERFPLLARERRVPPHLRNMSRMAELRFTCSGSTDFHCCFITLYLRTFSARNSSGVTPSGLWGQRGANVSGRGRLAPLCHAPRACVFRALEQTIGS